MSPRLHPYLTILFVLLVVARWRVAVRVNTRKWAQWLWLGTLGGILSLFCMAFGWWGLNYWAYWAILFAKHGIVALLVVQLLDDRIRVPHKLPQSLPVMASLVMVTVIGTPALIHWFRQNPNTSHLLLMGNASAVWMALPLWLVAWVCYLNREQDMAVNGFVALYSCELIAMALLQFIPATQPQAWALEMGSELVVLCWWWWELRMEVA